MPRRSRAYPGGQMKEVSSVGHEKFNTLGVDEDIDESGLKGNFGLLTTDQGAGLSPAPLTSRAFKGNTDIAMIPTLRGQSGGLGTQTSETDAGPGQEPNYLKAPDSRGTQNI